ncbi:MAG: hypothetical protein WBP55_09330 [Solirubrobacterales bacterium]
MKTLRRRWRLVLAILIVVAAIVASQFISNGGIKAGISLLALFSVIVLAISGNSGRGGINPWHHKSGSHGGGPF